MPGRYGSENGNYRYGFNGMESDDEMFNQEGNSYDFGARMYDSRIGRWSSTDALERKYTSYTPYSFVNNMPIIAIDPNGMEIVIPKGSEASYKEFRKNADRKTKRRLRKLDKSDIKYEIGFVQQYQMRMGTVQSSSINSNGITKLKSDNQDGITVQLLIDKGESKSTQFSALAEEISHAEDFENGEMFFLSFGDVEGFILGQDIHDEIKSKDASLKYMKKASRKSEEIELTEINEEWSKIETTDGKIKALTGEKADIFGDYSDISTEKVDKNTMNDSGYKNALKNVQKSGIKEPSVIYREKGETKRISTKE